MADDPSVLPRVRALLHGTHSVELSTAVSALDYLLPHDGLFEPEPLSKILPTLQLSRDNSSPFFGFRLSDGGAQNRALQLEVLRDEVAAAVKASPDEKMGVLASHPSLSTRAFVVEWMLDRYDRRRITSEMEYRERGAMVNKDKLGKAFTKYVETVEKIVTVELPDEGRGDETQIMRGDRCFKSSQEWREIIYSDLDACKEGVNLIGVSEHWFEVCFMASPSRLRLESQGNVPYTKVASYLDAYIMEDYRDGLYVAYDGLKVVDREEIITEDSNIEPEKYSTKRVLLLCDNSTRSKSRDIQFHSDAKKDTQTIKTGSVLGSINSLASRVNSEFAILLSDVERAKMETRILLELFLAVTEIVKNINGEQEWALYTTDYMEAAVLIDCEDNMSVRVGVKDISEGHDDHVREKVALLSKIATIVNYALGGADDNGDFDPMEPRPHLTTRSEILSDLKHTILRILRGEKKFLAEHFCNAFYFASAYTPSADFLNTSEDIGSELLEGSEIVHTLYPSFVLVSAPQPLLNADSSRSISRSIHVNEETDLSAMNHYAFAKDEIPSLTETLSVCGIPFHGIRATVWDRYKFRKDTFKLPDDSWKHPKRLIVRDGFIEYQGVQQIIRRGLDGISYGVSVLGAVNASKTINSNQARARTSQILIEDIVVGKFGPGAFRFFYAKALEGKVKISCKSTAACYFPQKVLDESDGVTISRPLNLALLSGDPFIVNGTSIFWAPLESGQVFEMKRIIGQAWTCEECELDTDGVDELRLGSGVLSGKLS